MIGDEKAAERVALILIALFGGTLVAGLIHANPPCLLSSSPRSANPDSDILHGRGEGWVVCGGCYCRSPVRSIAGRPWSSSETLSGEITERVGIISPWKKKGEGRETATVTYYPIAIDWGPRFVPSAVSFLSRGISAAHQWRREGGVFADVFGAPQG